MVLFCHGIISVDSPKIDGIARNPAMIDYIDWPSFLAYVLGFQRVAVLAIRLVSKGTVDDS